MSMSGLKTLQIKNETFLKLDYTRQADQLPVNQKYKVSKGQIYSYAAIDTDTSKYGGHLKVNFEPAVSGYHTWFVFAGDVTT